MSRGLLVDTHILLWMRAAPEVLALLTRDAKIAQYSSMLPG